MKISCSAKPVLAIAFAVAVSLGLSACGGPANQQRVTVGPQGQITGDVTPETARALIIASLGALRARNYRAAINFTTAAINSGRLSQQDRATAHTIRGDVKFVTNDLAGARDDFAAALEAYPDYAAAHMGMGLILALQRKGAEAERHATRAIELSPNSHRTYFTRGIIRIELKRMPGALGDLSKTIELEPKFAAAYSYRGTVLLAMGRVPQAKADYERALEIDPGETLARAGIDIINARGGRGAPQTPRPPGIYRF